MTIVHGGTKQTVNGGQKVAQVRTSGPSPDGKPVTSANPVIHVKLPHGGGKDLRSKDVNKD